MNGVSDPGEVLPASDWGIVELSCAWVGPVTRADRELVAAFSPAGVRFADGTTRPTYDILLRRRK
jgi:hypothetical protein